MAQGEPGHGTGVVDRWSKLEEAGLDELRAQGESRTTFILRNTPTRRRSHTNIVGTSRLDDMRENIQGILRGPLADDVCAEAKRRLDAVSAARVNS